LLLSTTFVRMRPCKMFHGLTPLLCLIASVSTKWILVETESEEKTEVATSSIESTSTTTCMSIGGKPCIFPFTFKGHFYTSPCRGREPGERWCATKTNEKGEKVEHDECSISIACGTLGEGEDAGEDEGALEPAGNRRIQTNFGNDSIGTFSSFSFLTQG